MSEGIGPRSNPQVSEPVLDPDLPIIDPHHHLWNSPYVYELPELIADLQSGHNVVATVHVEVRKQDYRKDGPDHLRPVGETELLVAIAEGQDAREAGTAICAGIVGAGDLSAGEAKVTELLDAHIAAGQGRFRGIRTEAFVTFLPPKHAIVHRPGWRETIASRDFLAGVECLARKGLALDLVCAHNQLGEVAQLANRFPEMPVIVNHLAPISAPADNPPSYEELASEWRRGIDEVAASGNVFMKVGGSLSSSMGAFLPGVPELLAGSEPATSQTLAEIYRPQVAYVIQKFGPPRCMFESNFPVERTTYLVLWNTFKILAQDYSDKDKENLLFGTASKVYNIH